MFDSTIEYSRTEIKNLVGGELITYLPQKNHVILAGCFNLEDNPDAPREIQAGSSPKVEKKANLLSTQLHTVFPVFMKDKVRDKKYKFKGFYRCIDYSTSKAILDVAENKSRRYGELSYVLYLEKASTPKDKA